MDGGDSFSGELTAGGGGWGVTVTLMVDWGAWEQDDTPERFYEMLAKSPAALEAFNKLAEEISARQHTLAQAAG